MNCCTKCTNEGTHLVRFGRTTHWRCDAHRYTARQNATMARDAYARAVRKPYVGFVDEVSRLKEELG